MTTTSRGLVSVVGGLAVAVVATALAVPAQATIVLPAIPTSIAALTASDLTPFQWALTATNTPAAWAASTGAGVTVAVVDTGVDATNPDLQGQVLDGARWMWDRSTHSLVLRDASVAQTSDDWYGHGSHVSGIIAGKRDGTGITGVAPDAKILPIQLLTRSAALRMGDVRFLRAVATSVRWANSHGAQVVNLSLGVQVSGIVDDPGTHAYLAAAQATCRAIADVTAAGTLVVVSAGNDGDFGNPANVPATCPGALTVAATAPSLNRTYWSSFDGDVRIAAPGESLLSVASAAAFGSGMKYVQESGTSMAAPMVAGAAALVFGKHPTWSPDQVADRLTSTAQDHGLPGRDPEYGYGLLDAAAAVGVAAPPIRPVDYLVADAEPYASSFSYDYTQSIVGWNVLAVDAATSYTIRVFKTDGSVTDTAVAGDAVRGSVAVAHGDWIQVIAHTAAGDVASWPTWWLDPDQVDANSTPPPVRHPVAARGPHAMTVTWRAPAHTSLINRIEVDAFLGGDTTVSRSIPVRAGKPFPTKLRVRLPESAKWQDADVMVLTYNGDGLTSDFFVGFAFVPKGSRAWYGLGVAGLHKAGPKALEVTAAVSALTARVVCHNASCVGHRVKVAVRRGDGSVQSTDGRLTSEGLAHVLIWVPKGTRSAVLRLTGPGGMSSGPFRRVGLTQSSGGRGIVIITGRHAGA